MKFGQLVLVVILSAAVAVGAVYALRGARSGGAASVKETRLEQVKRTGVIRCGYIVLPPFVTKDFTTGQVGGLIYDVMEEIGRQLKLKIEWTGETTWGQMLSDLKFNRFDVICANVFRNPAHAREGDFTDPIFYTPFFVYVRKDDTRFDGNSYQRINQPDVKTISVEGQFMALLADEEFPNSSRIYLPQNAPVPDQYISVATHKADATLTAAHAFAKYDAMNPGVLRPLTDKPLRILPLVFPLPADEPGFKAMINTTLAYLHNSGYIDKVLTRYDKPVKLMRVAKPYEE